jgi:hypothetical protein
MIRSASTTRVLGLVGAIIVGSAAANDLPVRGNEGPQACTSGLWIGAVEKYGDGAPRGHSGERYAGDVIVFTASQSWMSRVYVLRMDGSVLTYFHYDYYIFSDLEVVDNEVYVTDWIAPAVYKVDIETGGLELVIADLSLIYLYDLAWDGSYFYAKEWSLNRYRLDGTWAGSASLGETVRGAAWDGTYYWTLSDAGQIKCWDISSWPTIIEVPENAFTPPSPTCRGLWFDGRHFWTAERIADTLGYVYQFDYDGTVIEQWREPAFDGYAACVVTLGLPGDVDGDGDVDLSDLGVLLAAYDTCVGDPGYNPDADFDESGCVDLSDLGVLLANYGS